MLIHMQSLASRNDSGNRSMKTRSCLCKAQATNLGRRITNTSDLVGTLVLMHSCATLYVSDKTELQNISDIFNIIPIRRLNVQP